MVTPAIVWFRQDLRLSDNPALLAACESGRPIIPLYILDDEACGKYRMGGASRVWLHHSLEALNKSLGGHMMFRIGHAEEILPEIVAQTNATAVYWNRCYEPWRIARDRNIKQGLGFSGVDAHSFNGSLLWEPWTVNKQDGTPYRVFTPFFRNGCMGASAPRQPLPAPETIQYQSVAHKSQLERLNLLPDIQWDKHMLDDWTPGEAGAQERLEEFLENGLRNYREGRNVPDAENVSRLSPHLHFGEISPNQAWHGVQEYGLQNHLDGDTDTFLSELGWREFSHSLLVNNPQMTEKPLQQNFNDFPWVENAENLKAWQRGLTGYPIVDAGMRELWQAGYMHNRVRMVVGSFLVKHLRQDWRKGAAWFWDCLFDADLANNTASWQWIAGCGADAAPYFRIFNPVIQGEKFDADGAYVRRYVPELANMPDKYLHKPWEAPAHVLAQAGVQLGKTYPYPVVAHAQARDAALSAYKSLKGE